MAAVEGLTNAGPEAMNVSEYALAGHLAYFDSIKRLAKPELVATIDALQYFGLWSLQSMRTSQHASKNRGYCGS